MKIVFQSKGRRSDCDEEIKKIDVTIVTNRGSVTKGIDAIYPILKNEVTMKARKTWKFGKLFFVAENAAPPWDLWYLYVGLSEERMSNVCIHSSLTGDIGVGIVCRYLKIRTPPA